MKINCLNIGTKDSKNWNYFLKDISHASAHTNEYCRALENSTDEAIFLFVAENDIGRFILPYSIREKEANFIDIYTPYGYGGILYNGLKTDFRKFKKAWINYSLNQGIISAYIMQNPLFSFGKDLWGDKLYTHFPFYIIDLTLNIDEIWRQMHRTHRYEIRKINNYNIVTDIELLKEDLIKLYSKTLSRISVSNVYHFSDTFLSTLLDSKNSISIGAENNGKIEAISLFTFTKYTADYFINATSQIGRQFSRILIWEAIKILKQKGINYLNMGGGIKPADNLDQFKRRFGGKSYQSQVIKHVFQKDKFSYLTNKYCTKEVVLNNYFPPYWHKK